MSADLEKLERLARGSPMTRCHWYSPSGAATTGQWA